MMKFQVCNRLCLTLISTLLLGLSLSSASQADTPSSKTPSPRPLSPVTGRPSGTSASTPIVRFEPPTDDDVDDSRGGASRPTEVKCAQDETYPAPLTALVPRSSVGLTVAARPNLLIYVPPTTATQAHFTLRDANHRGLYQTQIPLTQTGGILSVPLPADSPELRVGESYQWSLALLCQPTQTDMPITRGQIQRVELADASALNGQSLLIQAATYGQAGVWHDMLARLVRLQQTQPEDSALSANWAELLQAENLGAIANAPLLNQEAP
ncbi:MAG: DUF928 domain-containing protein [Cyanobacteria bacterium P01_G01_bin.38]